MAALKLPHFVARTSQSKEANLHVWCSLCAHLLATITQRTNAKVSLQDFLPPECGIAELHYLHDYLPPDYRVTTHDLHVERGHTSDLGDYDGSGACPPAANAPPNSS